MKLQIFSLDKKFVPQNLLLKLYVWILHLIEMLASNHCLFHVLLISIIYLQMIKVSNFYILQQNK